MTYTSIKIKRRKSVIPDRQMPLCIQLIRHRRMKRIPLELLVHQEEWDAGNQTALIPAGTQRTRGEYLLRVNERIEQARQLINIIIEKLECRGDFTLDDIITAYADKTASVNLSAYIDKLAQELARKKRCATCHHYRSLQNSFAGFLKQRAQKANDIPLTAIDEAIIVEYEDYLNTRGLASNTVSFYLRNLRAIWNKAVMAGLVEDKPRLFSRVNTRIEKTLKRAVKEEVIKKLESLTNDQLGTPALSMARDLFLFSFYTRGMTFIDIAYLTRENIQGNMLVYTRKKTKQKLQIKILPEIKELIDRYHSDYSPYLFPVIRPSESEYQNYESALRIQNMRLQKISELIGCYLTTYTPRHTWASIAKSKGIPEDLISEGMGHTSVKTTRIYIALDNSRLDRINQFVISGNAMENYPVENSVSW